MIAYDLFGEEIKDKLSDQFPIIPFSVLDTKTAEWRNRKDRWLRLGIKSELGRDEDLLGFGRVYSKGNPRLFNRTSSVFDPVLCELVYDWFNVKSGLIIDPFSGGSVRGIVASTKGMPYIGIDVRAEQVVSNLKQVQEICTSSPKPIFYVGDSDCVLDEVNTEADLIFTCPPYFDLEKYSDEEADISNMTWDKFLVKYKSILKKSCSLLRENRFFVIVVGDVRDKDRPINWYRNLGGITKDIIMGEGLHLYNEMIVLDGIGSSAMRVEQAFSKRKLVKTHQNVYVFYKGKDVNDIPKEFE